MFLALIVYITMVVLPAIKTAGAVAVGLAAAITIGALFSWFTPFEKAERERGLQRLKAWIKGGWLKVLIVIAIIGAITPNEKVTWYIVGAYAAEKVATADATKQIAGETYDLFRDLIKKARENINEADATKLAEKTGKAIDAVTKAVDNNDTNKQGENK